MIKKLFLLLFGLGLGLFVGALVMKRIDEAAQAVAPTNVARNAGRAAGTLVDRFRAAAAETRAAAAQREAELRQQYHVPTLREALRID